MSAFIEILEYGEHKATSILLSSSMYRCMNFLDQNAPFLRFTLSVRQLLRLSLVKHENASPLLLRHRLTIVELSGNIIISDDRSGSIYDMQQIKY